MIYLPTWNFSVRRLNADRGKLFFYIPKRPDPVCGPPGLKWLPGFFPGVKSPRREFDPSFPSSAEV